jgi:hypothetical protein
MADEFTLTSGLITVSAPQKQESAHALDVSAYDEVDLVLHVPHIEGTSPSLSVFIETAMYLTDDSWVFVGAFEAIAVVGGVKKLNAKNLLKYIRWNVNSVGTGSPNKATFCISGMLRRWA